MNPNRSAKSQRATAFIVEAVIALLIAAGAHSAERYLEHGMAAPCLQLVESTLAANDSTEFSGALQ